jgi:hypothetical protein
MKQSTTSTSSAGIAADSEDSKAIDDIPINLSELNRKQPPDKFIGSDNFPIINFPVR